MSNPTHSSAAEVATEFIEQMGLLTEEVGMPRIAGRIMGLLLLTESPLDLEGIAERLQISHGSVSTNTRLLEQLGVVERLTTPGDRRVRFRLGTDPAGQFLERDLQRRRRMGTLIQNTIARMPPGTEGRANLEKMRAFHALAIKRSAELLREWLAVLQSIERDGTADPSSGNA